MPIIGNALIVHSGLYPYLATLPFLALYKMQQTSGTNEPNVGSLGSAVNMTITSTTLGQTGKLGANEAYLFDGAVSRLQCANNATLANKTAWEWVFLVKPSGAGEINFGAFFCWGDGNPDNSPNLLFNGGVSSLLCRVYNTTPTNFNTTTTTGLSTSAWSIVFAAFDNAGDRKVHLYKGISGAVTEFGYSAQPAMTGTYKAPTVALNLFNSSGQSVTFAGLGDFAGVVDGNLTPAQRLKIVQLAGV